jgi:hypothetical protein
MPPIGRMKKAAAKTAKAESSDVVGLADGKKFRPMTALKYP